MPRKRAKVTLDDVLSVLGLPKDADADTVFKTVAELKHHVPKKRGDPVIYKDGKIGLRGLGVRIYHDDLELVAERLAELVPLRDAELAKGKKSRLAARGE